MSAHRLVWKTTFSPRCLTALLLSAAVLGGGCERGSTENLTSRDGDSSSVEVAKSGVVVDAVQVTEAAVADWRAKHFRVALRLTSRDTATADLDAAQRVKAAGLPLDYLIEVARCPELADAHPEWMASLQGHPEWRKQFPDAPLPQSNEVIKAYPWVPVSYAESFEAQVERVAELLQDLPPPERIWLMDLQAAPSACGCGHPLCRWTADYGPIHTATPLDHRAAAQFVERVAALAPNATVLPIWVGECEAEDQDSVCCGVACFEGKCWFEWTKQLNALNDSVSDMGVACFYKVYDRDLPRYGEEAGWISYTLRSFSQMPPQRSGVGVPARRLWAVLQGWDVNEVEVQEQVRHATDAGVAGWMLCLAPIDQSWQPLLYRLPPATNDASGKASATGGNVPSVGGGSTGDETQTDGSNGKDDDGREGARIGP